MVVVVVRLCICGPGKGVVRIVVVLVVAVVVCLDGLAVGLLVLQPGRDRGGEARVICIAMWIALIGLHAVPSSTAGGSFTVTAQARQRAHVVGKGGPISRRAACLRGGRSSTTQTRSRRANRRAGVVSREKRFKSRRGQRWTRDENQDSGEGCPNLMEEPRRRRCCARGRRQDWTAARAPVKENTSALRLHGAGAVCSLLSTQSHGPSYRVGGASST